MKPNDHFLGDRVSVRCRRSYRPGDTECSWLGGTIISREPPRDAQERRTRYVVQLDDNRRVVAFDDDVRRFTLAFEIFETLEKMAS
ncbi:MAG: hypothetical protein JWO86_3189 [Myxococcaceae bacterium]|nr:hypothetical protein [Myxococcaceae bacterium]MEA2745948.1 hypothetical protein [Myxococcales bacterium]